MRSVEELRRHFGKVADTGHPIPGRGSLGLDTGRLTPAEAVNAVVAHYGLTRLADPRSAP